MENENRIEDEFKNNSVDNSESNTMGNDMIETDETVKVNKVKAWFSKRPATKNIVIAALFTSLIVIGSYTTIDVQPVPFTMQVPVVLLTALLLGPWWGFVSVVVYVALGLMGVPVFSSKGAAGITYVLRPSFGYIIGFIFASIAIGIISKPRKNNKIAPYWRMIIANFVGIFIIYAIGMLYMYLIMDLYMKVTVTAKTIFVSGLLLFLPKELVFIFLTPLLALRLRPHLQN